MHAGTLLNENSKACLFQYSPTNKWIMLIQNVEMEVKDTLVKTNLMMLSRWCNLDAIHNKILANFMGITGVRLRQRGKSANCLWLSLCHTLKKQISVKYALLNTVAALICADQEEKIQLSLYFSSQNFRVRVFFFITKRQHQHCNFQWDNKSPLP